MFRPEIQKREDAEDDNKSMNNRQIRKNINHKQEKHSKHKDEQKIKRDVTDAAKDLLAKEGYDRMYGARPLRRVITSRIEDQLSEEVLRGRISRGDTVVVDGSPEGGFTFHSG